MAGALIEDMLGDDSLAAAERYRASQLRRTSPALAVVVGVFSLLVVFCWATSDSRLQLKWRGLFIMKANTAVGLLLRSVALFGLWRGTRVWRAVIWLCCGVGLALSLLTFAEYLFHLDLRIDELFFVDFTPVLFPGRTAPGTTYGLIILAIAIVLTDTGRTMNLAQLLFFLGIGAPLITFGGYLYQMPSATPSTHIPIGAPHTAICELLLCLSGLLARPGTGLMRMVVSESLAGSLARKLLPLAVTLPIGIGLIVLLGEKAGFYSSQFSSALLVSLCALLFTAAVWVTISLLWKTEQTRRLAEFQRVAAEVQLRVEEDRLRIALSTAKLGTWQRDLTNERFDSSAQFKANFGLPPDARVTFETLLNAIHPDDRADVLSRVQQSLAKPVDYSAEYRVFWPDGSLHWLLSSGRAIFAPDGRATRFVGVSLDVTERKQTEEVLKASESRFRQLAETIPQLAWMAGPDGWIFWYNQRWYDYTGTTPEQMQGWGWQRVHDQDEVQNVLARWQASIQSGQPFDMTFPLKGADGIFRPFLTRVMPLRDQNGNISIWFGTNTDISEQRNMVRERDDLLVRERAARNAAEHASRVKDEFLATLSHELRTPLNAILGWAHLLARAPRDNSDLAEGLAIIERNARAQNQIIEDLLDMSRIIAGKLRLDVQKVQLDAVVRAAIGSVQHAVDAKGISLTVSLDPLARCIAGDPNRLQQILWNLLSNAIKFTPKGGQIRVMLERADSSARLSVQDSGEGVDPDFLPFVFDRFRQADGSTTRRHGGLGLGLAIVKQIVELHGGSVAAKSEGLGSGATFAVDLPLAASGSVPQVAPGTANPVVAAISDQNSNQNADLDDVQVLVVDDEADARRLIGEVLGSSGAQVTVAGSSHEAMRCMEQKKFDVLVSDIGMPFEDGLTLIGKVRSSAGSNCGAIPAIALTAYARMEDRVNAINAGFTMHLAKPVEPVELIAMVAAAAGRSKQPDTKVS